MTSTVTDEQIVQLSSDAAEAGDLEQVALCTRALTGDDNARDECARAIEQARSMADSDENPPEII